MRRIVLLLALTLLACGAVSFTPEAAQAHDTCTHHGYDFGCVSGTHHERFAICDQEADGNPAYLEADVWYYGNIIIYDTYGSAGCNVQDFNNPAWSYRVCEDRDGADSCTSWRTA
jgi:hypothetical protein